MNKTPLLRLVAFTQDGAKLAARLAADLTEAGFRCEGYATPRYAAPAGLLPLERPVADWAGDACREADALVWVGACGIAVRAVAPHLRGKDQDPAVVVLDDQGRFAISLLSGHLGGANRLAHLAAQLTGAQAVVTTATDGHRVFSVDDWAAQTGCAVEPLPVAKEISVRLLDGGQVGFCSDFPTLGPLPTGLVPSNAGDLGICVTATAGKSPFAKTLRVVPRVVVAGVGCRRGASAQAIAARVDAAFAAAGLSPLALAQVCTIDCKADEPGLLAFCAERGVPLVHYPAQALQQVEGSFTPSAFVQNTVGVDNVCERAAVLGANGSLLVKKQAGNGVTAALALREWRVAFC